MNMLSVKNNLKSEVYLGFQNFNGRQVVIKPGLSALLSEEEISYITNTSSVFKLGSLTVENPEKLSLMRKEDVQPEKSAQPKKASKDSGEYDDRVAKYLDKTQDELKRHLGMVKDIEFVKSLISEAKKVKKSESFIKICEDKLEELEK